MTTPPQSVARIEQRLDPHLHLTADLRPLRELFARLMDQMAERLQSAGLDQDDCVLDRLATLRLAGSTDERSDTEHTIVVQSLTDLRLFLKPFYEKCLQSFEQPPPYHDIHVTGIELLAIRAPDYPPA